VPRRVALMVGWARAFLGPHTKCDKRQVRSGVRTMIDNIAQITTAYLSSHTSSRRAPL
jgi:hypothetical protein